MGGGFVDESRIVVCKVRLLENCVCGHVLSLKQILPALFSP